MAQAADAPGVTGAGGGLGAGIGGAAGVAVPSAVAAPIEALPAGAGPVARGGVMAIPAVTARRGTLARVAIHTVLLLGCLLMVFPFYWMVITSFKTNTEALASPPTLWPQEWHPENYPAAMAAAPSGATSSTPSSSPSGRCWGCWSSPPSPPTPSPGCASSARTSSSRPSWPR